jgi:import receptor subunit TOM70
MYKFLPNTCTHFFIIQKKAEILVKRAGVRMDSGKLEEAISLFDAALELDPSAVDALLHRANLRMLEQKPLEAKADLERCIELRPNHIFAHLRLATIFMAVDDAPGAKRSLDTAEQIDPQSSEVHSYRGELFFAQGQMEEAKAEFDRATECDGGNPTAYVNAALAVMNTPGAGGGPPDIPEAIRLLEKAIGVDPQFHTAYVHLGQLKLSMATSLTTAKEVVALYDKGLEYCRTADELRDIVSMRILTVAQVDAASALKMDTLNMQ